MPGAQIYEGENVNPGFVQGPSVGAFQSTFGAAEQARGAAIEGFGAELGDLGQKLYHANQFTKLNDAKTKLLTGFNDLDTQYAHQPDVDSFNKDATKLVGDTIADAGLDPRYEAELRTFATRQSIGSQSTITKAKWTNDQAQNLANLSQSDLAFQTRYLRAGSDTEREAVFADHASTVQGLVAGGWMQPDAGQKQIEAFRSSAQQSHAAALISADPTHAIAELSDPERYTYLNPVLRQDMIRQAQGAQDAQGVLQAHLLAQRDPAAAAAGIGRTLDPRVSALIFSKGVIPQESGGDPSALSPKGAAGLTQMMPGTARAAAQREALGDVAQLSDADISARLRADPQLATRLGLNEFNHLLARYNGSVPAALAGYNAGPGRADNWHAQAIDRFGANYSAEQFASLVGIKETHDYIGSVYARLGARTDGFGLSTTANLRAQTTVLGEVQSQINERKRLASEIASLQASDDPIAKVLKQGYDVDPSRMAAFRQVQAAAAANGDAAATRNLRELDHAQAIAPVIQQAYQMPPAQLAATVASETQRLAQSPSVGSFEMERLDAMKTVLANVNTAKGTNPVGLAERAGMFKGSSLPVDQPPSSPGFAQALRDRDYQTVAAAHAYDGAIVPLKPEEAGALKNAWENGGPSQKVAMAASFAANMRPEVAEAAVRQVAGGDRLSLTAGIIATRDPALAQKILEGSTLLESKGIATKAADVREALRDTVRGQIYASPQMQNDAVEAGMAVYAANRARSQGLFDPSDRNGLESAIEEVTGKIASVNGARVPVPPGFSPAAVTRGLRMLRAEDLAEAGGLQKGLDASFVGANAQLHALKIGGTQYAVTLGDLPVMNAGGDRPLVVDLAQVAARQAQRNAPWTPQSSEEARAQIERNRLVQGVQGLE